jgi:hypothetical protein
VVVNLGLDFGFVVLGGVFGGFVTGFGDFGLYIGISGGALGEHASVGFGAGLFNFSELIQSFCEMYWNVRKHTAPAFPGPACP